MTLPISGEWVGSGFEVPAQTIAPPQPQQPKLCVVLPFIESDLTQVVRLLKWSAELSGRLNYSIFLLPFKGLNFTEVKMYAERAFSDVQVIPDMEGMVSDWKSDSRIRDAAGPNSMFRQAAWYFYFHKNLGPWLYLEPDCAPLKKDWLQQLETDYRDGNKPISGVAMESGERTHLNGVAIYPPNLIQVAPEVVTRIMWEQHQEMEVAFDVAGGKGVMDKAHLTDKIQFRYRSNAPQEASPSAALYHGDRSGQLIETLSLLRKGETFSAAVETGSNQTHQNESVSDSPLNDPGIPLLGASDTEACRADNGAAGKTHRPIMTLKEIADAEIAPPTVTIGDEIRYHCDELLRIVSDKPSRKIRMVEELRKRKLIPRTRKIWNLRHR